jgi:hypothetical protein
MNNAKYCPHYPIYCTIYVSQTSFDWHNILHISRYIYTIKCYHIVLCYLPSLVAFVIVITLYMRTKILVISSISLRYEQTVRTLGWKAQTPITNTPSRPHTASYHFVFAREAHTVAENLPNWTPCGGNENTCARWPVANRNLEHFSYLITLLHIAFKLY